MKDASVELLKDEEMQILEHLFIKGNPLTVIPKNLVQKLPNIIELHLSSNNIVAIPQEIEKLVRLKYVDLSGNALLLVCPEIGRVHALRRLHLAGNQLTFLPPELGELCELETLDVSGNRLRFLPERLPERLRSLKADRNLLRLLPPRLSLMPRLLELSLVSNRLTRLPLDLGCSDTLMFFFVDHNAQLNAFPSHLYNKVFSCDGCGLAAGVEEAESLSVSLGGVSISLPCEVKTVGTETNRVLPLEELVSRHLHAAHTWRPEDVDLLPQYLLDVLLRPLGQCHCCGQAMFTIIYPKVYPLRHSVYAQLHRRNKVCFVAYCCSSECVRTFLLQH